MQSCALPSRRVHCPPLPVRAAAPAARTPSAHAPRRAQLQALRGQGRRAPSRHPSSTNAPPYITHFPGSTRPLALASSSLADGAPGGGMAWPRTKGPSCGAQFGKKKSAPPAGPTPRQSRTGLGGEKPATLAPVAAEQHHHRQPHAEQESSERDTTSLRSLALSPTRAPQVLVGHAAEGFGVVRTK